MIDFAEIQNLANRLWLLQVDTKNEQWAEIEAIAYPLTRRPNNQIKICEDCGKEFFATNATMRSCSDSCRKDRRRKKEFKPSVCRRCGSEFEGTRGMRYCQECLSHSFLKGTKRIFK